MKSEVFVVTSAFGADLVRQSGQQACIDLIAHAGAQGVEIRRELFDGTSLPLAALGEQLRQYALQVVYSVPEALWQADGTLALDSLQLALQQAATLGAKWLKFSLGHFSAASDLGALAQALQGQAVRLLVENDQTIQGGSIERLQQFFAGSQARAIPVGMTFDIGNWYWSGADPFQAAGLLGRYVEYIHCKGAQQDSAGWHTTVPEAGICDWKNLLLQLPADAPRAIEFALPAGKSQVQCLHYVALLATEGRHA
jgi:sugar phosphate isomerase/epimerase